MCYELENSGIRVAVGDCSVTERRRLRPPYQTGKTVHVHATTILNQIKGYNSCITVASLTKLDVHQRVIMIYIFILGFMKFHSVVA